MGRAFESEAVGMKISLLHTQWGISGPDTVTHLMHLMEVALLLPHSLTIHFTDKVITHSLTHSITHSLTPSHIT